MDYINNKTGVLKVGENNDFFQLVDKEILQILDGDTQLKKYTFQDTGADIVISMPYLTGPRICEISNELGFPASYGSGTLSRWQYMQALFERSINANRCSKLLEHLFRREHFSKILSGHTAEVTENAHLYFVESAIEGINGRLYFSGYELIWRNDHFVIRKKGEHAKIQTPQINKVESVKHFYEDAMRAVDQHDFDSAVTKSRTMLEEVFIYALEAKKEPVVKCDINNLYTRVRKLYHMHTDDGVDERTKKLLSGLNSIVSSVAEMRNNYSDAHGKGSKRVAIAEHHARLVVNSATAMAEFVLSVVENA